MFKKEIAMHPVIENLKEITMFLLLVILVILFRLYILTPAVINGESMMPTLHNGDIVFLNKYARTINRFDIIVHDYGETKLVKRAIGLPGEHIAYRNSVLYVNNQVVTEPLTFQTANFDLKELGYDIIPEGYYFVLGDNRNFSQDSRMIGLIPIENILGRTSYRFYPFDKIGRID